jgi:hypothetical protein
MHRLLALLMMVSAAYAGTIAGPTDWPLEPKHAEAMRRAVLDDLGAKTAYFSSLSYKRTASGEDRDVICGIVSHGGEYAFYFVVSENDATILPRLMGSGGRDMLIQQLQEVGCPSP